MTIHEVLLTLAKNLKPFYEHQTVIERKFYESGQQCLHCRFYQPLEGRLGADWGACFNPSSYRGGLVVFEHFTCTHWRAQLDLTEHQYAVLMFLLYVGRVGETEQVGVLVGCKPILQASSWAYPKLKRLVQLGYVERVKKGQYRASDLFWTEMPR